MVALLCGKHKWVWQYCAYCWHYCAYCGTIVIASKLALTSESVDEILWCDHSNETLLAVLSHGTIHIYSQHTSCMNAQLQIFID